MKRSLQILTFLAIGSLSLFAEDKQKPIKALLITGGCCHNYVFQSQALIAGVAKHAGQLALIATAPVTFGLPAGFHLFWLSSTLFTAASGEAFRLLDKPPPVPPSSPVAASSKEASPRPRRRRKGKKRRS